jgi:aminoglycoside phosphotransferase (APT) family kinase protein
MAGEVLTEVREAHRIDERALAAYLAERIPGFKPEMTVRQFEGGQSNPTYLLSSGGRDYVMRKKPPGRLLATAHQVEREYRIMTALRDTRVPVPRTFVLCEDPALIGTPFFVMEFARGRLLRDRSLPDLSPERRRAIYMEMCRVLAELHAVRPEAVGLADYGKPGNYFKRQIERWTRQYLDSKTEEVESMEELMKWLPANMPDDDSDGIVHGDFLLNNMIFDPEQDRIIAVIDWELSTLGHPLADLAYNCMPYHQNRGGGSLSELTHTGIPSEEEYVAHYCEISGRKKGIENWNFYLAFSFFRYASIIQGVYKRGLQGNASSQSARGMWGVVQAVGDIGWGLARR